MASFEKRGKNYRAVVSVMKNGIRQKVSQSFKTKKEASDWATTMESDKIQGKNITASKMLFSEYFEFWMNTYKKNDIRESTYIVYKSALKNIQEIFKDVKLDDLTGYLLQSKMDNYGKTRLKSTVNQIVIRIKACLKDALYDGYIKQDCFSRLKAHGLIKEKTELNALSVDEFETLQDYLYSKDLTDTELAILIALETGMRIGEVLALSPSDISTAFLSININKSFSPMVSEITSPKNKSSIRVVKVTDELIEIINNHKSHDNRICNVATSTVEKKLSKLLKQLQLHRITVHGLRHSHASYLLYQGVSVNFVSKRLGHADTVITRKVYSHMLPEEELEETDKALSLLSINKKKKNTNKKRTVK